MLMKNNNAIGILLFILTLRIFCFISTPSTCVMSFSSKSIIADVPKCFNNKLIQFSLDFKNSKTCKQVN